MERCAATAVAWMTSQTVYSLVTLAVGRGSSLSKVEYLIARAAYAGLAAIACPLVSWVLRREARGEVEVSLPKDFLELARASYPFVLAWAWKDCVQALLAVTGDMWWDTLLVAVGFIAILTAAELAPCYRFHKASIQAGGSAETIYARFAVLPESLALALGYSWKRVATHWISRLQATGGCSPACMPVLAFLIQAAYYVVARTVIIYLTTKYSEWSAARKREAGQADDECILSTMEHHAADIEETSAELFISAMSFVYAWALSDTLNEFYFNLLQGCPSASKCSYQSNFVFALVITVAATQSVTLLKYENRTHPWGKSYQALQVTALSLTVTWSWMGYMATTISSIQDDIRNGALLCYGILLASFWLGATIFYHYFMMEKRRWAVQRASDARGAAPSAGDLAEA